jgi:putative redox protein
MKVEIKGLKIALEGSLTDVHPKVYESIHLKYIFTGEDLDTSKLQRAIDLSQEKYCGVTAMLQSTVKITSEIIIQ